MKKIKFYSKCDWHLDKSDAYKFIFLNPLHKNNINCIEMKQFHPDDYNPDNINVFLSHIPIGNIDVLSGDNNYFVPLYDDLNLRHNNFEIISKIGFKIISFSNPITGIYKGNCSKIYQFKYFPDMTNYEISRNNNSRILFYWNRYNLYLKSDLQDICEKFNINKLIVLNKMINAGFQTRESVISENCILGDTEVIVIDKSLVNSRDEYLKYANESNMFLCSRRSEGIGVSNLEQLCRGSFIIGIYDYTICEYVKNNVNGLLLNNPSSFKNFDVSNININSCISNNIKCFRYAYKKYNEDIVNFFTKLLNN